MNIFVAADVLIDLIKNKDFNRFVEKSMEHPEIRLWASAATFLEAGKLLGEGAGENGIMNLDAMIRNQFAIVPLRRSILMAAASRGEAVDFGVRVDMASIEAFPMTCCITRNRDSFTTCAVPVYTPEEWLENPDFRGEYPFTVVPFLDLKAQLGKIYNEIDDRYTDIISNCGFILGKYVEDFEKRFAEIQGAKYCVAVSSGTDALHIALHALGIGPDDSVVVPVHTFIATAEAVSLCGAFPVFCDCDEDYTIDIKQLEEILEEESHTGELNIRAIIPVHLYGQPARMDEVMALAEKYNVMVIEDACQAHLSVYKGLKAGNIGQFGAFSFYPGKNLGAFGEGGALITNDEALYQKARMIRQHGEIERYHHRVIGHNYRMSAFQGAALGVKLNVIEAWTEKRRKNARLYTERLQRIPGVVTPMERPDATHVYHLYVIQVEKRDELMEYLKEKGVYCGLHYPIPLHLQEAYRFLGYRKGNFLKAETLVTRILSLPMYPELSEPQIDYVCHHIEVFMKSVPS